jgi:hypothetical protein
VELSSLLQREINYGRNMFYDVGPRFVFGEKVKLFSRLIAKKTFLINTLDLRQCQAFLA